MLHGARCRLGVPLGGFGGRRAALTDGKDVLQDDPEVLGVIGLELVGHPRYRHKQPVDEVLWAGESSRTDSVPAHCPDCISTGSTETCTTLPTTTKNGEERGGEKDQPLQQDFKDVAETSWSLRLGSTYTYRGLPPLQWDVMGCSLSR